METSAESRDYFQCPLPDEPGFWDIPETLGGRCMRMMRVIAMKRDVSELSRLLAAGWPGQALVAANPLSAEERAALRARAQPPKPHAAGLVVDDTAAEVPIPEAAYSWIGFSNAVPHTHAQAISKLSCAHLLWQPLIESIQQRRLDYAEVLLKAGAPAWFGGKDRDHPVTLAVMLNHPEMLELLLRYGAEPSSPDTKYQPLCLAIQRGKIPLVRLLCHALAPDDELPWSRDHSALYDAYAAQNQAILAEVMPHARSADFNDAWAAALTSAADSASEARIVSEFMARGADPSTGLLALINESRQSDPVESLGKLLSRRIQLLLEHGADPESQDDTGTPALLLAAAYCPFPEALDTLIAAGASKHAKNHYGYDLLGCCALSDESTSAVFHHIVGLGFSADSLLEDTSWIEKIKGDGRSITVLKAAEWSRAQWQTLFESHPDVFLEYADDILSNPSLPSEIHEALLLAKTNSP